VVAKGAATSKQVAAACGAGADCGRCRHTVRAMIAAGANRRSPSCTSSCALACRHLAAVETAAS